MIEAGYSCTAATLLAASTCSLTCGNTVLNGAEQCDLGTGAGKNEAPGTSVTGCTTSCLIESGFVCANPIVGCSTVCGDGIRAGTEGCDDGNLANGDGCKSDCSALEPGWTCSNNVKGT